VERWRPVNLITGGRLLATNTSPLLAGGQARSSMTAKSKQEVPNGP
jgi:hypothetical protein